MGSIISLSTIQTALELGVIYSLVAEFTEYRLKSRSLPAETAAYASPEHPLLPGKTKKPSRFRLKKRPGSSDERKS